MTTREPVKFLTHAERELEHLTKLRDRRSAIGLPHFRDPHLGETSAQYRDAQDREWYRKRSTVSPFPDVLQRIK